MFDLSFSELLVIGVVALIVIGPKEIPGLFRTMGRFTAKMRGMARDFSRAMEQAADESGVKDVAKDLKAVANPKAMGLDMVKDAARKFENWDPLKPSAKAAAAPVTALGPKPQVTTPDALADRAAERKAVAEDAAEKLRAAAAAPKDDA